MIISKYSLRKTALLFTGLSTATLVSSTLSTISFTPGDIVDSGMIVESISQPVAENVPLPPIPDITATRDKFNLRPSSNELRYIALGGSIAAGVRDGGLYREGQIGAYPNLLARQLGILDFHSPIFDLVHGNGTGYYLIKSADPYPKWQRVVNNSAIIIDKDFKLQKYNGQALHNMSLPHLGLDELEVKNFATDVLQNVPIGNLRPYPNALVKYPAYLQRLLATTQEGKKSLQDIFMSQKADFYTIDIGLDLFLGAAQYPRNVFVNPTNGYSHLPLQRILSHIQQQGAKAVIFTVPQVIDWPYFHIYQLRDIEKSLEGRKIYIRDANNHPAPIVAKSGTLFIPTSKIDASFRNRRSGVGLNSLTPICDEEVLSPEEVDGIRRSITAYNQYIIKPLSQQYNFAIVDLESIYKRILSGHYITTDGLRIDPSYPSGNFFSADGLTPTAIGQAVLANEIIESVNAFYHIQIPLININLYSQHFKR